MNTQSLERINVNFPRPVLDDLRRLVPAKRRSEVIARATARELRRLKIASAFETLGQAPAWRSDKYLLLTDVSAIDLAIRQLRVSGIYARAAEPPPAPARRKARRE